MVPDPSTRRWVIEETKKLEDQGWIVGSPAETRILQTWKAHRPAMYRAWEEVNLVEKLAFVLDFKADATRREYIRAGMPPTDATEQATRDWLMLDPEE
jgi:hypothetical protein